MRSFWRICRITRSGFAPGLVIPVIRRECLNSGTNVQPIHFINERDPRHVVAPHLAVDGDGLALRRVRGAFKGQAEGSPVRQRQNKGRG